MTPNEQLIQYASPRAGLEHLEQCPHKPTLAHDLLEVLQIVRQQGVGKMVVFINQQIDFLPLTNAQQGFHFVGGQRFCANGGMILPGVAVAFQETEQRVVYLAAKRIENIVTGIGADAAEIHDQHLIAVTRRSWVLPNMQAANSASNPSRRNTS